MMIFTYNLYNLHLSTTFPTEPNLQQKLLEKYA